MNKLITYLILFTLSGCKSTQAYEHPVKIIYTAPYSKQSMISYSFLETQDAAKTLGTTLLSIYYSKLNIDFNKFDSIEADLVNNSSIWKVKIIRNELLHNIQEETHYFAYIRKSDGALLYVSREQGEWIGSTDLENVHVQNKN